MSFASETASREDDERELEGRVTAMRDIGEGGEVCFEINKVYEKKTPLLFANDFYPDLLGPLSEAVEGTRTRQLRGRITEVIGMLVKAVLSGVKVGELCELRRRQQPEATILAEVVGFTSDEVLLMPLGDPSGLSPETEVIPSGRVHEVAVGEGLLGRVLDGLGNFMDDLKTEFIPDAVYPANGGPPCPLSRQLVMRPLCLGVRVLDAFLTCGEGQRMGIFAAAGVGKSVLLAQLLRNTDADVVVLALIGERGREVREFLEMVLTEETRDRTVVVVSTSDRPALEWIKSAYVATTVAEYFRDQGKRVLLLIDSLTRFARAQRLVGLTCGEPPARRGFPPSVFAILPRLLERAGNAKIGSITALYTVLVEGDDMNEPVADEVRSLLDGHIILSRNLAAANHFPAISVLESVSRVMTNIAEPRHIKAAGRIRELMAKYEEAELLLKIGEYKPGIDPLTDEAIAKRDEIRNFLQQKFEEFSNYNESIGRLIKLASQK